MNGRHASMRRRLPMLLAGAAIAACGLLSTACTTSKPIILPVSGINSRAYVIDCSGASLSWSHCYRRAGETCPLGYSILDNSAKHGDRIVAGDVLQLAGNSALHRRLVVNCKAAGQPPPAQSDGGPAGAYG